MDGEERGGEPRYISDSDRLKCIDHERENPSLSRNKLPKGGTLFIPICLQLRDLKEEA